MYDLDEVVLVRHDLVDVLVGAGDFVDDAAILAADHARGLRLEVGGRKLLLRLRATHAPAGAVRARVETVGRPLAAHDIAARTHAARDDAELALPCADRAFARNPDVGAIV